MNKKKICLVTAARSEYGLLKWVIQEMHGDADIKLQLIVTGSHLSEKFGFTYREIETDGYDIDEKVDMRLNIFNQKEIAVSMGYCAIGMAECFDRLKPDLLLVLGDRYELLPICSTALLMDVPIAHISGGDITEGALDDQVRHSISKMATLHFPGSEESAKRLVNMGEYPETVLNVGELGVDGFRMTPLIAKTVLASEYQLNENAKWVLLTYHPETKISLERNKEVVIRLIESMDRIDGIQVIMSYATADFGGEVINKVLEDAALSKPSKFKVLKSFGYNRYINMMRHAFCMVGNSSSGLFEAPSVPLPVINIGNRQKGRMTSVNVITIDSDFKTLNEYFDLFLSESFRTNLKSTINPYGDGYASRRIKDAIKSKMEQPLIKKGFYSKS